MKLRPTCFHLVFLLCAALCLPLSLNCSPQRPQDGQAAAPEIIVAAAANLTNAFEEIGQKFTAQSRIRVVYSFGATADLAKQIENGAPFDVYAAADVEHVDRLSDKGFITPGTPALYARGRLVLWAPPGGRVTVERVEDLTRAEVRTVALAKPDIAPYGRAAVEALQALRLWEQVAPKAVYGQNVAQAKQFAASGNADAAFLPLALVIDGEGKYLEIPETLHRPIDQAIGVVKASGRQDAARQFLDFVMGNEGQDILARFGYLKPQAAKPYRTEDRITHHASLADVICSMACSICSGLPSNTRMSSAASR